MKALRRRVQRAGRHPARDPMERFHDEWLGMLQPVDGLVVSKPALRSAQIARPDDRMLRERLLSLLTPSEPADALIANRETFFAELLGLGPERWLPGAALPESFRLAVPDTGQLLEPSAALVAHADASPVALLWNVADGLPLDVRETVTGAWDYPASAKLDRLLRHAGVAIGLLCNGRQIRLIYAPHGATTGSLTFPISVMMQREGRPVLDAFVMLLHATRWFGVAAERQLPAILAASREAQGQVTQLLAAQVLEALHVLLAAFEQSGADGSPVFAAAYRDPALGAEHVYSGLLTFMLRLVFVLYAEDSGLLPVDDALYARHFSVLALYEELADDAGAFPEAMSRRFGAYGRLISLFRAIYSGVAHGPMRMPPRHGELFSPDVYGFLEANDGPMSPTANDPEGRRRLQVPAVDDETVYRVLRCLLMLGEERLAYKSLDVEQIGAVYENLVGYRVIELSSPAVCLKKSRTWVSSEELAAEPPGARSRWLQEETGLAKADADRAAKAMAGQRKPAALLEALIESGFAGEESRMAAGRFVIQPSAERRRSGSHYTPRSLTKQIVEKALAPLLAALPRPASPKRSVSADGPSSEALLSLKICDPAMGSGAFLVEVVRQLGDHVVAAWRREGRAEALLPSHGPAHGIEDAVAQARRLVAQRCVYGVDRNPLAVTLAKLSLWLVTLAKNKPFSFVDHALRWGDSLVGLSIEQITAFHWGGEAKGHQHDLVEQELRSVLREAVEAREGIVKLALDDSPAGQKEKARLLRDAEDAVRRLRCIGDLVLGAFFSSSNEKERQAERIRRRDLAETWLRSDRSEPSEIHALAQDFCRRIPAFHWMIEFPEVFWVNRADPLSGGQRSGRAWMDAFVGNPPFAGKNTLLSMEGGESLLAWLKHLHPGAHGNSDYAAHFFRRCGHLLGEHGTLGLIATNTIAQGDTRTTGLKAMVADGGVIYDAVRSLPWPGAAAVTVSVVHMAWGVASKYKGRALDGVEVKRINSRLRAGEERPDPVPLKANAEKSFQGSIVLGMGFVLTPEEREALIKKNKKNGERIFPYIGGEEVNSHPLQEFDRYVINFGDMTLEEAGRWPDLLAIVQEKVKPERERQGDKLAREYWWRFIRTRNEMYAAMSGSDRCIVISRHSKNMILSFQETNRVFSEATCVFPMSRSGDFSVLQSRVHEFWARLLGSTMKSDMRYSGSDCLETFPLLENVSLSSLDQLGQEFYNIRAHYAAATWQGLTTTYNQLKEPGYDGELSPSASDKPAAPEAKLLSRAQTAELHKRVPALAKDPQLLQPETRVAYIQYLRHLHEELDRAVLAAYGWSDIAVPPYCPPRPDDRAGQAALARFEDTIIDRLFALNAARAAEEAAAAGRPPPIIAAAPVKLAAKRAKQRSAQSSILRDQ